jgi:hypothetical protein
MGSNSNKVTFSSLTLSSPDNRILRQGISLSKEKDKVRLTREAKAKNSFYVPAEAKLAFVMRIKGYIFGHLHLVLTRLLQSQERFFNCCVLSKSTD